MCFNIDSNNPNKQIADKDITCYKVMFKKDANSYLSQFKSFLYNKGETYKVTIDEPQINRWAFGMPLSIEAGFHSYSNIDTAQSSLWMSGFGSLNLVVVECIIPIGSEYYYNPIELEYVSNQVKIIGNRHDEVKKHYNKNKTNNKMKVRIEGTTIDTKDILAIGPITAYWPKEIEEFKGTYYFNIQLIHDYKIQISRSTT